MEIRWSSPLALARRSLRTKIIAWFFVPTAIILVAVALVNCYAYQNVTEDLVLERDRDLIRLGAGQFATELAGFTDLLYSVARDANVAADDRAALHQVVGAAAVPLAVFDGGLLVIDTFGTVMAAGPQLPELVGQDWSDRRFFRRMVRSISLKPAISDITTVEPVDTEVIIVAVPITGAQGQFFGSVAGMFRLGRTSTSAFYGAIVKLSIGGSGNTYLVDRTGRVIYHSDPDHIGADFSGQPVVQQALAGQSGAVRTDDFDGRDIVAGFAEVPSVEWGLITEESWADVTSGSRRSQRALLLLLALGVVMPALLVAFGLRRIMRPIKALTEGAQRIAGGNFDQPIVTKTGDEIQALAQQFNTMAGALKESYTDLERRVADRTADLRQSEERYRALFEESRDAIFVSSHDGSIVAVNRPALDLFGFALDEAIGSDVGDRFVSTGDRDRFRQTVAQTGSVRDFEVRLKKSDGVEIDCLMTATRRVDEEGGNLGVQGVIRDVTERKKAEATLLEQTRDLAVLGERNRMAREIHDTMAQGFTGIVLQLEAGEQALDAGAEDVSDHLSRAKALARDCLQAARRSVWNLLPRALERQALSDALRDEVRQVDSVNREKASFTATGGERELPAEVQTALLRICQQGLTNARSHAGATEVGVSLSFTQTAVALEISDNGVGFDLDSVRDGRDHSGFGLIGMEQRARLLGGDWEVDTAKGRGTRIRVTIPAD